MTENFISHPHFLFNGKVSFWQEKRNLEISLVHHLIYDVIEIIAYDFLLNQEARRIYLNLCAPELESYLLSRRESYGNQIALQDFLQELIIPRLRLQCDGCEFGPWSIHLAHDVGANPNLERVLSKAQCAKPLRLIPASSGHLCGTKVEAWETTWNQIKDRLALADKNQRRVSVSSFQETSSTSSFDFLPQIKPSSIKKNGPVFVVAPPQAWGVTREFVDGGMESGSELSSVCQEEEEVEGNNFDGNESNPSKTMLPMIQTNTQESSECLSRGTDKLRRALLLAKRILYDSPKSEAATASPSPSVDPKKVTTPRSYPGALSNRKVPPLEKGLSLPALRVNTANTATAPKLRSALASPASRRKSLTRSVSWKDQVSSLNMTPLDEVEDESSSSKKHSSPAITLTPIASQPQVKIQPVRTTGECNSSKQLDPTKFFVPLKRSPSSNRLD
eukprot:gene7223-7989_t